MRPRAGFVILLLLFVTAAGFAIIGRGPWYDEFYSFYMVRPDVSVATLAPAWMRDNHPPVFYALAWLWARLLEMLGLGHTVELLRTVNCAILGIALVAALRVARSDPWFRAMAWYYALALAALFTALDRIDQLRSYFLSLVLTALVLPLLAQCLRKGGAQPRPIMLGVVLMLAFTVHLVTTVIVLGLVGATITQLILVRRRPEAWRLATIAAIVLVPFALFMAAQMTTIVANTTTFWIPPGPDAARWAIEQELSGATTANPLLAFCALAGTMMIGIGAWRGHTRYREPLTLIVTFVAGTVLALALLIVAHLHRPMLITRYLVALDPIVAMVVAITAAHAVQRLPLRVQRTVDAVLLLATAPILLVNLAGTVRQWSWNGTTTIIARQVHQCADTRVFADLHWNGEVLNSAPRDNRDVLPFAYAMIARRHGFALSGAGSRALSATCPNLFWTEHAANLHPSATTVIAALRAQGYRVESGQMVRRDLGWVLITPPVR